MPCACVPCASRERRFRGRAWIVEAERLSPRPPRPAGRHRVVVTRIGRFDTARSHVLRYLHDDGCTTTFNREGSRERNDQAPAAFAGLRCPQSQLQAETRHRRRQARDAAPFERPRLCGRLRARKPAYPVTSPGDAGVGSRTDVKALSESPLVHLYCKKLTPLNLDGFFHPEPDHVGRQVDLAKASHDDRFSQPRPARPRHP